MADLINAPNQESDGGDVFLDHIMNWGKDESKAPSEKPEDNDPPAEAEETDEPTEESQSEDDDSPSEDGEVTEGEEQDDPRVYVDDDEAFAKVTIGDEEHEVPVKDLKRLYGQESAITKRGQELANIRTQLEQEQYVTTAAQTALLEAARKRYEPYQKLDFLALSRDERLSKEQFQSLREEAQHRWEEVNFLEQQARGYAQSIQQRNFQLAKQEAEQAVSQFKDPASPYHIQGWNQTVYDELRSYAIGRGIPQKLVDSITNPAMVKVFHTAMTQEKGAQLKNVKTVKVNKTVKKVMKNSHSPAANVKAQSANDRAKFGDKSKAMKVLQSKGKHTNDDVANAFLASFREFDSE